MRDEPNTNQALPRIASLNDFAGIIKLLQEEKLPTQDLTPGISHFLVIELDEKIVGVAGIELYENLGLLRSVAVDKNYRNRSLATILIDNLLLYAAQQGITTLYLITTGAENYFEKKGFVAVNRDRVPGAIKSSSEFSTMCPSTATVMIKALS